VLRIQAGHSVTYYLDAVATGREAYYTGAVAEGEPPGRWYGGGAGRAGSVGSGGRPGRHGGLCAFRVSAR
jgi:hypothetical protein